MSFPRYPTYKPSGVEWLGEVPEHWTARPLRSIGNAYGGLTGKTAGDFTDEGRNTAYYIPFTNILNNIVIQPTRVDPVQIPPGEAQNEVRSGDLLFLMSSEDFEFLGFSSVVREVYPRTFLNSFCKGFRPSAPGVSSEYLNYYCRSRFGRALISQLGFGFTRINLRTGALLSVPVLFPPLPEQQAIAAFLDRETAKIDGLVAEQQRLIELLKEKRQAVISHAVTKGLDPKAPMKPSGVEWLGEVPEHWEVKPIRKVARLESGHTPSRNHPEYWEDCTVPWFTLADVWQIREEGRDVIFDTKEKVSELGLANSAARRLPAGTVMLSRTASVGFSAIMGVEMATTQDFANWVCSDRLWPQFLLQVFRAMQGEFRRLMMGSTHSTIYMPDIQSFRFAHPPLQEQRAIVAFLERELRSIDSLMSEATTAITLLQERRSALISAAVTGQIDVRATASTEAA